MSDGEYTTSGVRLLLAALLARAARDARAGDALAWAWLAQHGQDVVDDLEVSLDLAAWLIEQAPPAQGVLPGLS